MESFTTSATHISTEQTTSLCSGIVSRRAEKSCISRNDLPHARSLARELSPTSCAHCTAHGAKLRLNTTYLRVCSAADVLDIRFDQFLSESLYTPFLVFGFFVRRCMYSVEEGYIIRFVSTFCAFRCRVIIIVAR